MSKIIPYGKRIVVKKEEIKETTEGGLYIPEVVKDKEKRRKGTVIATCENSGIEIDDVVIFGSFAGLEVDNVLILKLDDIHGIEK